MRSRPDLPTLLIAACVLFLTLLLPLALLRARRKPLLLLEQDRIAQNVPGGLEIRWTDVAKVDLLVTSLGKLARVFVADWPAITRR